MTIILTREEVERHCVCGDTWVMKDDKVYDVSLFAKRHPGGERILLEKAGQDVKEVMGKLTSDSRHSHSDNAYALMEKYCIGRVGGKVAEIDAQGRPKRIAAARAGSRVAGGVGAADEQMNYLSDWELDDYVDWSRPLLWQVGDLGKKYTEWVDHPVDRPIRLFERNWMEAMSRSPPWTIPAFWGPIVLYLFVKDLNYLQFDPHGIRTLKSSGLHLWLYVALSFSFGLLTWTLFEYLFHRHWFHAQPSSKWLIMFHFLIHGQHHKYPLDPGRFVMPVPPAAFMALIFYHVCHGLVAPGTADLVFCGTIVMYNFYEMSHWYYHVGQPRVEVFRVLKRYHMMHHYINSKTGFGLSTPLWDYPFGTLTGKSKSF